MEELLRKLIIRIVQNSRKNHINLCVTRATKLMYLIEWKYFGWMRKRLTSLDWIYLHYGPWSAQLSSLLRDEFGAAVEEEVTGQFREVSWSPPEYSDVDTRLPFELEGVVQRVFENFGAMPTKEIIGYVYSNTEPMQYARKRGQPLDFKLTKKPTQPFNPVKALDKKLRKSLRDRLRSATEAKLAEKPETIGDISPEISEVLSRLDSSGNFFLPKGEIQISDKDKLSIARED